MNKVLKIDDKWSIEYDPLCNDRPLRTLRYGEPFKHTGDNIHIAMFYALLEATNSE